MLRTGEAEGELEALHADDRRRGGGRGGTLLDLDRVLEVYAPIQTRAGGPSAPSRSTSTLPGSKRTSRRSRDGSGSPSAACSPRSTSCSRYSSRTRRAACRRRTRARPALTRVARVVRAPGAELARDRRDAECDRRGEGSVHGRALAAGAPDLARDRAPASASPVTTSSCSVWRRSSTTSARSAFPTRSSRSRGRSPRRVRVMREHPAAAPRSSRSSPIWPPPVPIVRHHHERWDGRGYPDGLAGEEIPLAGARSSRWRTHGTR